MLMTLEPLRAQIDDLDRALIELLGKRFRLTAEIGRIKARDQLNPVAADRERQQFSRFAQLAAQHQVPPALVGQIFRAVIGEVVSAHQALQSDSASEPRDISNSGVPDNPPDGPFTARREAAETAPDGSAVIPLARAPGASHCFCTLPAGQVSRAVAHRTVEELWYCLAGRGEFYSSGLNNGEPFAVQTGMSWRVPPRFVFQFRNPGPAELSFVITTLPAWPGDAEADTEVAGVW